MFLKSEKIFQIVMFFGNHRWRVYQIWKTITNLNKIIESISIILQIPNKFANPRIVAKSRNILQIRKNILSRVTCGSRLLQSAVCRIQNGGVLCLVFDSCWSIKSEPWRQILLQMCFQSRREFTSECKNKYMYTWRWTCFVIIVILGLQSERSQRI